MRKRRMILGAIFFASLGMSALVYLIMFLLPHLQNDWAAKGVKAEEISAFTMMLIRIEHRLAHSILPAGTFAIAVVLPLATVTSGIAFLLSFFHPKD